MEFSCKICQSKCTSLEAFILHFDFNHRVSAKSRFSCGVDSCHLTFLTRERFESHVLLFHTTSQSSTAPINVDCPPFSCCIADCNYKCNAKSTLRVHRKRKHGQDLPLSVLGTSESLGAVNVTANEDPLPNNTESVDLSYPPDDMPSCSTNDIVPFEQDMETVPKVPKEEILKKIIHFYLSLNSKYHVPDSTIQYMITSLYSISQESNKILKEDILNTLRKAGIDIVQQIDDSVTLALSNTIFLEAHSSQGPMRSHYMRQKIYKSGLFTHIAAQSRNLGFNEVNEKRRCHIVSIKDTLVAMMEDDSIFEQYQQTQTNRTSLDGYIRDMFDGSLCKSHPVLSKDRSAIGILLDADDLEIASALGAAKGKHKVMSVAYTLTNFEPWSRMKQDIIKLSMLVAEKDVAYFGLERVLESLIEELSDLAENGLEIRGERVKVVLVMLLGDNLGTHTWTGLVENFSSSKFFCRYCEESRGEWRLRWQGIPIEEEEIDEKSDEDSSGSDTDSDISEDEESNEETDSEVSVSDCDSDLGSWPDVPVSTAPMRTPQSHNHCLEELKKKNPSTDNLKGIVGYCELNKLKDFNWVGATPPCIAHDLFEGVISYDVALALKYFYRTTDLTPAYINSKLKSLKMLGCDQGSKPAKVKEGMTKLRGGAVQNWNFLRFLPFLVGNKVNCQDKVWKMLMLLTKLTRVLTSPTLKKSALPDLKEKIHLYLTMRCVLFPEVPLRPKHHYLEHYPTLIEVFGCLMRVNTLGFESKHRFLKNTAAAKKNFKNITKTLSEEHQLYQSAISVDSLTCNYPTVDDAFLASSVCMSSTLKQAVMSYFGPSNFESLTCSEKVKFHGKLYRKGEVLLIGENPLRLSLIELVFLVGKSCYAAGWVCTGVVNRCQLVEVTRTCNCSVVNLSRLADYLPYPLYSFKSVEVVVLKHSTQILH